MSSGGSRNQLELPRGANYFFGFAFGRYGGKPGRIGDLTLLLGASVHAGRPLRWHGSNMMERLNLPTGIDYSNTFVLFRRRLSGYEIYIAAAGSNRAIAWQQASAAIGARFRAGNPIRFDFVGQFVGETAT